MLANEIGLVAADVEIAMPDLPVVIRADRVVALADMHEDVNVVRQSFDRDVDRIDGRSDLLRRSTTVK